MYLMFSLNTYSNSFIHSFIHTYFMRRLSRFSFFFIWSIFVNRRRQDFTIFPPRQISDWSDWERDIWSLAVRAWPEAAPPGPHRSRGRNSRTGWGSTPAGGTSSVWGRSGGRWRPVTLPTRFRHQLTALSSVSFSFNCQLWSSSFRLYSQMTRKLNLSMHGHGSRTTVFKRALSLPSDLV